VGLPKVDDSGRTLIAAWSNRDSAGVSHGTSRREVTTTSDRIRTRSSSAISS
jgi:hypothetical protein